MKTKQKRNRNHSYSKLERILSVAGVGVIILGVFITLYSIPKNLHYVHDPLDVVYYSLNILLLGGGFLAAFFATRRRTLESRLFAGAVYALLAMIVYSVSDIGRLIVQDLAGEIHYPVGKIVFTGLPVVALGVVIALAFIVERKSIVLSAIAQYAFIGVFLLGQLYLTGLMVFLQLTRSEYVSSMDVNILMQILQYVAQPILVAMLAFLLFTTITSRRTRVFYASFIGGFYFTLYGILWEFSTDPYVDHMVLFGSIVTLVMVLATWLLIWRARLAIK